MAARRLTRREFLRISAGAGATLALGGPTVLSGCGGPTPLGAATLGAPRHELGQPVQSESIVAAARGTDLPSMTREVLSRLGGLDTIVHPGESVFIKPNFLTAGLPRVDRSLTGEITKPDIAVAVAEECLRLGARDVIIGDGAQVERFDWEDLTTVHGTTSLAAEAARLNAGHDGRLRLACLNSDSPAWDPLPSRRTNLGEIYVSSLVARADRIISIPVLKTHRHARLTLSLKNLMGITPIARYGGGSERVGRHILHRAIGGPPACFLDMAEGLRPDLAIIDASIGCEDYGPWVRRGEGRRVDLRERSGQWLLLASTDLVAADATAARVIGHDPLAVGYLADAYNQGLGQARLDLIRIAGAALDELRVEWEPA